MRHLPAHQIKENLFVDGGVYAHSPALNALRHVRNILQGQNDTITCLSIGTTMAGFKTDFQNHTQLSGLDWLYSNKLLQVSLSCQQQYTDQLMHDQLGKRFYIIDHPRDKKQSRQFSLFDTSKTTTTFLKEAASHDFLQFSESDYISHLMPTAMTGD